MDFDAEKLTHGWDRCEDILLGKARLDGWLSSGEDSGGEMDLLKLTLV